MMFVLTNLFLVKCAAFVQWMLWLAIPLALCMMTLKWAPLPSRLKQYGPALFESQTQYKGTMRLLTINSATCYSTTIFHGHWHPLAGIPKIIWKANDELFVSFLYASTSVLNGPRVKSSPRSVIFSSVTVSRDRRFCLPMKWKKGLRDRLSVSRLGFSQIWQKHSYCMSQKKLVRILRSKTTYDIPSAPENLVRGKGLLLRTA